MLMNPKVYLETTIISYLTAWPSRDLIKAAHQQLTREWWQIHSRFELFVSQAVVQEAGGGDQDAAQRRLHVLEGIPILAMDRQTLALAHELTEQGPLPKKATVDALHIAVAVVNGMDYLLTWNCAHIANASMRSQIERVCRSRGYQPPVICTPEELMGD